MTAAAATGERILELGLPSLVAAAAHERLALLLKLGELAPRVLDAGIHLEAFRAADQAAAKNEEALEAAGILHRRAGALEHAVGPCDLLVDAAKFLAVAPPPPCAAASSCWSCMQRICCSLCARLCAADEAGEQSASMPRRDPPTGRRRVTAPQIATNAHDVPIPEGSPECIMPAQIRRSMRHE